MVKWILIMYFIKPNISTILAFQHVANIKIIIEIFYVLLH